MNNNEGIQKAAEILRLVVPRLSRLKWPVNPVNYALWYEYFAGSNALLNAKLDELDKVRAEWSAEMSEELFRAHILGDGAGRLDSISRDVRSLLAQVLSLVVEADGGFEDFSSSLKQAGEVLQAGQDAADSDRLEQAISMLVAKTETMVASNAQFRDQLAESSREVERLRDDLEKVKQEASVDPLTGLGNRKVLECELIKAVNSVKQGEIASLLMLDVDHFKRLNDRFGHIVGDRVLKYVGVTLTAAASGRDTVARFGGEEFCIILRETGSIGAMEVAEGIRRTIEQAKLKRSETGESLGRVTISIGVTSVEASDTMEALIERADRALYTSKNQGRNRVTASTGLLAPA